MSEPPDILAAMFRSFFPNQWTAVLILSPGFILLGLSPAVGGEATIEGIVKLPTQSSSGPANERYQVKDGKVARPEAAVAVVYLEGKFEASADAKLAGAEMMQKEFQFAPGVLPIQVGATVSFPNADAGYHNVFSYSKTKRFDLGRYRKDEKPATVTFDKPGAVKLYCEIHEHMRATILVLDTPYFTRTDATGKFKLEKLPSGQFTLKAWLDDKKVLERQVTLKDGETLKVDFTP